MTTASRSGILNTLQSIFRSKDIAMIFGVIVLVALMVVPIPTVLVDVMLALSITISIAIILLTMFIREPMEFSVFPTVLLLVTLLRLGINISITRQILVTGFAGKIVATFGNLIVGGDYIVGVVLFLILMIIQFVVINNGAGRWA